MVTGRYGVPLLGLAKSIYYSIDISISLRVSPISELPVIC